MTILLNIINTIKTNYQDTWDNFNEEQALASCNIDARVPLPISLLSSDSSSHSMFLIAEIKQASPSQGIIVEEFDPIRIADLYVKSGVHAISVLTEEHYFKGSCEHLQQVRQRAPHIPLLRKDFIVHPYQVYEAYCSGADLVLLIVAALEDTMLRVLYEYIEAFGMTPLVEVHNEEELARALQIRPRLLGINNRDLHTFSVDINTTINLIHSIPQDILQDMKVISESGIFSGQEVTQLQEHGVSGILVGQSILEHDNPRACIYELIHGNI